MFILGKYCVPIRKSHNKHGESGGVSHSCVSVISRATGHAKCIVILVTPILGCIFYNNGALSCALLCFAPLTRQSLVY